MSYQKQNWNNNQSMLSAARMNHIEEGIKDLSDKVDTWGTGDIYIAAGFFEVEDYNEETGEITFVYASNLYDMSYNETTGILTIQAS